MKINTKIYFNRPALELENYIVKLLKQLGFNGGLFNHYSNLYEIPSSAKFLYIHVYYSSDELIQWFGQCETEFTDSGTYKKLTVGQIIDLLEKQLEEKANQTFLEAIFEKVYPADFKKNKKNKINLPPRDSNGKFLKVYHKVARFDYPDKNYGYLTARTVQIQENTPDYLTGVDLDKGGYRKFLKSKIVNLKIKKEKI